MTDQFGLLRLLIAISDHQSLAATARALSISPATVTQGLQRLEEQSGVRLAIRTTRRITFTDEGMRLVADARRILTDLEDSFESLSERGPLKGPIRLTATHDFGRTRLVPLIDSFMREHDGVHVSILLSDGVTDLAAAGLDLAIRIAGPHIERPNVQLLRRGSRKVCAAPGYWSRRGKPSHPRDLAGHNCIYLAHPDGAESSWTFIDRGERIHVRVAGDRTASDGSAVRSWCVAGAGVLLNAIFDVGPDIDAGRLEPVLEEFTQQEVNLYAVLQGLRPPPRRVRALIDFLDERI